MHSVVSDGSQPFAIPRPVEDALKAFDGLAGELPHWHGRSLI
jgi:hypothetical protein